ncbi:hypothetical protein AAC691_13900 [Nguyenibacter vanlangensis]|uniref:Uncharacterized protein n=1 Tax=Nguyenibacter vanlangensis TaxID=1216886 RepID=A0ABZ3D0V5_9PROT
MAAFTERVTTFEFFGRHTGHLDLTTHQFHPDAHNGGIGLRNWRSLTMRRTPRVNQESLLRLMFAG